MNILSHWLRTFLPDLPANDRQLADDLTLRGIAVEGVHAIAQGHLFEMDITTNRVDAMNHYGIAREAATIYNLPLAPLDTTLPPATHAKPFPIHIEADTLCGRFTARVLRNVTIGPSTGRVSEYFTLLNQRQISNAVDASNFVLLAMGQPTHAFDLDKIQGSITVRLAHPGEPIKLLDGTSRILTSDDLVIADDVKALSLAGVMGGWDSMITPSTTNILIEAAWFDPAAIRASARRHGFHTDASHRFERGADFNAAPIANDLVAQLILHHGGQLEGDLIDLIIPAVQQKTAARPPIRLSVHQVQRHLGTTVAPEGLTRDIIQQYLQSLGCTLTPISDDLFQTHLPSWRLDLEREIDLIEEVARVYGYNRFANTLPTPLPVIAQPQGAKESAVRTRLLALGFSESISSTFASDADVALFHDSYHDDQHAILIGNALSAEARLLRPTLVPGMLTMLATNLSRDVREVRLFEQGQVFTGPISQNKVFESAALTLGLTGAGTPSATYSASDAPFYELKGAIESVISLFAPTGAATEFITLSYLNDNHPSWLEPGRAAAVYVHGQPIVPHGQPIVPHGQPIVPHGQPIVPHGKPLALFGELSRAESTRRKLRQPVYLASIDLEYLYTLPLRHTTARDLSRFQAVERDFSFTFPDTLPWADIRTALESLNLPELQSLKPVEIFRDRKGLSVPKSHYALLIRAVFQSNDRTLAESELTHWWFFIINTLTNLGGVIRAPEEALHT